MLILGQNKILKHGRLEVYADNGFVRLRDTADGSITTLSVKDCALRVKALSDMIKNTLSTNTMFNYDNVIEMQRVLEGYVDVMRQAQEQGMPSDPSARRDRARRATTRVSMASVTTDLEI